VRPSASASPGSTMSSIETRVEEVKGDLLAEVAAELEIAAAAPVGEQ